PQPVEGPAHDASLARLEHLLRLEARVPGGSKELFPVPSHRRLAAQPEAVRRRERGLEYGVLRAQRHHGRDVLAAESLIEPADDRAGHGSLPSLVATDVGERRVAASYLEAAGVCQPAPGAGTAGIRLARTLGGIRP